MTRATKNPGVFADNASTVIPATPVSGRSYRNTNATAIETGWPYDTIVSSADFAQHMYGVTSLTELIDRTGILRHHNDIPYQPFAYVVGDDGHLYRSVRASTGVNPVNDRSGAWVRAIIDYDDSALAARVTANANAIAAIPKSFGNVTGYRNVTSEREAGSSYMNDSQNPMFLNIVVLAEAEGYREFDISVAGGTVFHSEGFGIQITGQCIVPSGAIYEVSTLTAANINIWIELN